MILSNSLQHKPEAMKKIIFALTMILLMQQAHALPKKSKIPVAIQSYIGLHFPNAERVHWMIHEGNYIISLYHEENHVELCLNENGEYMNSIKEIAFYEQIPNKIKTQIDVRKLVYAEKLESKDGQLFYIFEVALAKGRIEEMVFDSKGNEIKDHVADDKNKEATPDVLQF